MLIQEFLIPPTRFQRFNKGDVLVTTSTGEMSDEDAERAGLVSSHAYAMLDLREVNGVKFFQLKNPWNHLRWKGRWVIGKRFEKSDSIRHEYLYCV